MPVISVTVGELICLGCNAPKAKVETPLEIPAGPKGTKGTAPLNSLTARTIHWPSLARLRCLMPKMSFIDGDMGGGLGLGEVISKWEE
jgi:hypothetical protein